MSKVKRTPKDQEILTPAERRTLAALAEGFVPGGGAARAQAAERAFATVVDPELVSQLRLVLRLWRGTATGLNLWRFTLRRRLWHPAALTRP